MPKFMTKNKPREAHPSLIPSSPQLWRRIPAPSASLALSPNLAPCRWEKNLTPTTRSYRIRWV